MRQLILKTPTGHTDSVLSAANKYGGKNSISVPTGDHEIYILFLPNDQINEFLKEIEDIDPLEINLIPRGILNMHPPESEVAEQVADVHPKSSLEIYLGGIQSVGSMFGLIGYSLAAGIIVWIGLYTTTVYLLVAAMLIAPFAGPAMNAALATAAGKSGLLASSLKRYVLAIGVGIIASFLLTIVFPLETLTPLMIEVSHVSKVAIFLPLVSGFAGAVNICQSDRDSLVSGAAVGILVAASLAPPVGLIGVGFYMMDWEIVLSSLFRIALQLLGIHLSATLVFYFYGKVSPGGIRFLQGAPSLSWITSILVVIGIAGMMYWQFSQSPFLRKASMNTELTELLHRELSELRHIKVINKDVNFTNTKIDGKPVVTYQVSLLPTSTALSSQELKAYVIEELKNSPTLSEKNIYGVYEITVVED